MLVLNLEAERRWHLLNSQQLNSKFTAWSVMFSHLMMGQTGVVSCRPSKVRSPPEGWAQVGSAGLRWAQLG